jgi:flagellar basal-body rod protein FlgB
MDLNGIPLFSLITNRMSWLSSRQSVLAENVANSDTPGYIARDMRPLDFEQMMSQGGGESLNTTNVRHISVRPPSPFEAEEAFGEGGSPTGNVVSLEQEMIKLSDTQLQYQTATNLYQKAVNMFRTALGGHAG